MRGALLVIAAFASMTLASGVSTAAAPLELKSVKVDLPSSDTMFSGPGAKAVNNNCLACHSASMVLTQPLLSKAQWTTEVNKMIDAYKAPIVKQDVGAIVDYLSKLQPAQ
jgi:cytochrome c5